MNTIETTRLEMARRAAEHYRLRAEQVEAQLRQLQVAAWELVSDLNNDRDTSGAIIKIAGLLDTTPDPWTRQPGDVEIVDHL